MNSESHTFCATEQLNEFASAAGYDCRYLQLEPGPLSAHITPGGGDGVSLIQEQVSHSVEFIGAPPKGYLLFLLVVTGSKFRCNGHSLGWSDCLLVRGGAEVHIVSGGGVDTISILISESLILPKLHSLSGCITNRAGGLLSGARKINMSNKQYASILRTAMDFLSIERLRRSTRLDADSLYSHLKHELISALVDTIPTSTKAVRSRIAAVTSTRSNAIIRSAIRAGFSQYDGTRSVRELSEQVGVSERTLERAFNSELGLSPKRYTTIHNLNSALLTLRSLSKSEDNLGAVSRAASESGFNHLGRFSGLFKAHFGVLPKNFVSDTRNSEHIPL